MENDLSRIEPLQCHPVVQPRVWGGRVLQERFGKSLPDGALIGESWEVVDFGECQSQHTAMGRKASLQQWVAEEGQALMGSVALDDGAFPIMVKLLDVRQTLSVQVHPDEAAAARLGATARAKNEAWMIIEASDDAHVFLGFKPGVERSHVEQALARTGLVELLVKRPVRVGDSVLVPAGTIHALGADLVAVEIQQLSDTTYRLYDWDRLGLDGAPRELHVPQAMACMRFQQTGEGVFHQGLVDSGLFQAGWQLQEQPVELAPIHKPRILVALDTLGLSSKDGSWTFERGQVALLPASLPVLQLSGPCVWVVPN
jgi:mannose-6-phosphate isomerase